MVCGDDMSRYHGLFGQDDNVLHDIHDDNVYRHILCILLLYSIVYEEFSGFDDDITNCRTFEELPETCQKYIERLEELCECKVCMVGVGPDRDQMIER